MALGDRIKGIIELFENLEDILPLVLKLVECFKSMSMEHQDQIKAIIVARVSDDNKESVEGLIESIKGS